MTPKIRLSLSIKDNTVKSMFYQPTSTGLWHWNTKKTEWGGKGLSVNEEGNINHAQYKPCLAGAEELLSSHFSNCRHIQISTDLPSMEMSRSHTGTEPADPFIVGTQHSDFFRSVPHVQFSVRWEHSEWCLIWGRHISPLLESPLHVLLEPQY